MPIKNTAGGKTFPKKGRLGSGAYWPAGTPITGNVFGPNTQQPVTNSPPAPRPFGSPTNAGNNTQFGQNRVTSGRGLPHPNSGFNPIQSSNKVPAFTVTGTGQPQSPYGVNNSPVIQPQERNRLHSRKVFGNYRSASGVNNSLPSDTAFHRVPSKQAPMPVTSAQAYTLAIVRAGRAPSFTSKNNLWSDPNNSFLAGKTNINGETGRGRWSTVKKGAAG